MAFERVKQIKDVIFSYECDDAGGVTFEFYTDMPGGAMAIRKSVTLPQTTTRETCEVPLDFLYGTLFKFRMTCAGVVKLYSGILRLRPIGVYMDGARGDQWYTQEMGIGGGS